MFWFHDWCHHSLSNAARPDVFLCLIPSLLSPSLAQFALCGLSKLSVSDHTSLPQATMTSPGLCSSGILSCCPAHTLLSFVCSPPCNQGKHHHCIWKRLTLCLKPLSMSSDKGQSPFLVYRLSGPVPTCPLPSLAFSTSQSPFSPNSQGFAQGPLSQELPWLPS